MKDIKFPALSSFFDIRYPPAYNVPSTIPREREMSMRKECGKNNRTYCIKLSSITSVKLFSNQIDRYYYLLYIYHLCEHEKEPNSNITARVI